jgi:DNA polymerase-4
MDRSVFHVRLQNFEIQAERILDASLRTRPIAVISSHHQNGTIIALSTEAEAEGLCQGMKVSLARKIGHSALLMPYNSTLYARMHHYVTRIVTNHSPLVEPTVFGQYYLDMSGMEAIHRSRTQAGYHISNDIHGKAGLAGQIGISTNKLVSHIATIVTPEKIHKVNGGDESKFLAPLTAEVLPTVREQSVQKLVRFLHLKEVQHIQNIVTNETASLVLFRKYHVQLAREAWGKDTSMVTPPTQKDHIVEQIILKQDTNDETQLRAATKHLAEQVAFRLRYKQQVARSITVAVHYIDGYQFDKTDTTTQNDNHTISTLCLDLLQRANRRRTRIRAVVIDATDMKPIANQLMLFKNNGVNNRALSSAMDTVRTKYGFDSIQSAAHLNITK